MTLVTPEKHFRRLHTPRENRSVVVHPAWNRVDDLVKDNLSIHPRPDCEDYDFQGRSLSAIARQARLELHAAARRWTAQYRDIGPNPANPPDLIFLAGHQPQMFHPGVWLKNFALGRLAEQHQATAINLIVDSDAISTVSLRVPGGSADNPSIAEVQFDRRDPMIPYEERCIEDRAMFDSFGRRVLEQMGQLIQNPLIETFWPMVIDQSREADRLGACMARARHLVETRWGISTLEIPQSRVCDLHAFHWFVAHLLAQLPRFSAVYNEAVHEYRRMYRIRSAAHPVPDLAVEDEWLEAPFWIWSREDPRRKRLFVKHGRGELLLSDRHDINARLPLSDEGDGSRAVEQLAGLVGRGVKIRSRALVTTLWARMILSDLFIHGIGGGNYDLVTDRIIERFFHRKPPGFMILSATLHLPIKSTSPLPSGESQSKTSPLPTNLRSVPGEGQGEGIDRQLRDLTYHPERFLDDIFDNSRGIPEEVRTLIDSKRKWIDTPQTIENAKTRCQVIRQCNESLQPWLEELRRQLLNRRAEAAKIEQAERILSWREYGFCLYPEETLRNFLDTLLPR